MKIRSKYRRQTVKRKRNQLDWSLLAVNIFMTKRLTKYGDINWIGVHKVYFLLPQGSAVLKAVLLLRS